MIISFIALLVAPFRSVIEVDLVVLPRVVLSLSAIVQRLSTSCKYSKICLYPASYATTTISSLNLPNCVSSCDNNLREKQ